MSAFSNLLMEFEERIEIWLIISDNNIVDFEREIWKNLVNYLVSNSWKYLGKLTAI